MMKRAAQPLSLKARAIALLAQREQSAGELRRKLTRIARAAHENAADPSDAADGSTVAEQVEALLQWLQEQGLLSEARFVEARVQARARGHGNLRIRQELAQHGLTLDPQTAAQLRANEFERALALWRRKFGGQTAVDAAARAKQMRFLSGRGFSAEVVRRVVQAGDESED